MKIIDNLKYQKMRKKCELNVTNEQFLDYLNKIDRKDAIEIIKNLDLLYISVSNTSGFKNFINYDPKYIIKVLNKLLLSHKNIQLVEVSHIRSAELMFKYNFKNIIDILDLLIEYFYDCSYRLSESLFKTRNEQEIIDLFKLANSLSHNKTNVFEALNDGLILQCFTLEEQMQILKYIDALNVDYDYDSNYNLGLKMIKDIFYSERRTKEEIIKLLSLFSKYIKTKEVSRDILSLYMGNKTLNNYTFEEQCKLIEYLNANNNDEDLAMMILSLSEENKSVEDKIKFIDYYKNSEYKMDIITFMDEKIFRLCKSLSIEEHYDIFNKCLTLKNKHNAINFVNTLFIHSPINKETIMKLLNQFISLNCNYGLVMILAESSILNYRNLEEIIEIMNILYENNFNSNIIKLIKDITLLACPYKVQLDIIKLLINNNYNYDLIKKISYESLSATVENNLTETTDNQIRLKPVKN